MLSADEAKKIGIDACIEKLGFEFCKKHADNATSAYGEDDGIITSQIIDENRGASVSSSSAYAFKRNILLSKLLSPK